MTHTANLGMYDAPWLQHANDALWAAVHARLATAGYADLPITLDRARPLAEIWRDSGLVLGQTCGYPLVTAFSEVLTVIGAPVYKLPGCEGGRHCSFIIVAKDTPFTTLAELKGHRAAMNNPDSNTGMNLLRHAVAPLARDGRFFDEVVETGGHLASLANVQRGAADVAAIDCVTFGLAQQHRPDLTAGVRVLTPTASGPALPFVTRAGASPEEVALLRATLNAVLNEATPDSPVGALCLRQVVPATLEDYAILLRYQAEAIAAGYPALA